LVVGILVAEVHNHNHLAVIRIVPLIFASVANTYLVAIGIIAIDTPFKVIAGILLAKSLLITTLEILLAAANLG
jgi:general stress protein CsbA